MEEALNRTEEKRQNSYEYTIRYLNGEKNVKEALIESFFPLARAIARTFLSPCHYYGIDIEDLYSVGYMSIVKTIERINHRSMEEIITYISQTIKGDIKHYIRDHISSIHFPRSIKELSLYIIPKLVGNFMEENDREPTTKEMAELIGIDEKTIVAAVGLRTIVFSIGAKANDDDVDLWEIVTDPLAVNEEDIVTDIALNTVINSLDDSEKEIIMMRFYDNMTQQEVANELSCTQMTISRREKRVLQKIRSELGVAINQ
jgi:RNA polymerase sporulation-specific sigma factor